MVEKQQLAIGKRFLTNMGTRGTSLPEMMDQMPIANCRVLKANDQRPRAND
jgi:hypothetical protein